MKKIILLVISVLLAINVWAQSQLSSELKRVVTVLASDSLKGRRAGSVYDSKAAKFVTDFFLKNGIEVLYPNGGQDFSYIVSNGDTLYSRNVLAIVEGSDSILKNEYIVVGAHFDHLGSYNLKVNGKDSVAVFPGADDNASGVASLMMLSKMISERSYLFKRSVIFAAFGAEENGMTGSWYFVNRAFREIGKVGYMVNLDMVGRSGGENYFRAYTVVPNIELNDLFAKLSNRTFTIYPKISTGDYFPSDHQPFASAGIPVTLFTTGLHNDYHTVRDTPEKLDYSQMEAICEYVFDMVRAVSDKDKMLRRGLLSDETEKDPAKKIYSLSEVDTRPRYINGNEKDFLNNWVYKYVKYPEEALKLGVQGRVVLEFVIEKDGSISEVDVMESAGQILDDEAVKVIKASPKWKPARIKSEPVRCRLSVPVEFRLRR